MGMRIRPSQQVIPYVSFAKHYEGTVPFWANLSDTEKVASGMKRRLKRAVMGGVPLLSLLLCVPIAGASAIRVDSLLFRVRTALSIAGPAKLLDASNGTCFPLLVQIRLAGRASSIPVFYSFEYE